MTTPLNYAGLFLGLFMLFSIGLGFLWVIKLEYYVGAHIWKWVLAFGIILSLASICIPTFWGSALLGITGGSVAWGATELPDQENRVERGFFPANPKRVNRKQK
jgi:hypothetical protein